MKLLATILLGMFLCGCSQLRVGEIQQDSLLGVGNVVAVEIEGESIKIFISDKGPFYTLIGESLKEGAKAYQQYLKLQGAP